MVNRLGRGESECVICGMELENVFHFIKKCQGTRGIAFASKWGYKMDS